MSLASLPMYDLPALRPAAEAWWRGLAAACRAEGLTEVPEMLTWPEDPRDHWQTPELLFSQTCGFPLMTAFGESVSVIATPSYAAEGCSGPFYSSALVVRREDAARELADLRGRRAAFNSRDSQSGYNVLRALVAPLAGAESFFTATVETGGHGASLDAVAEERADIAAIDCVTFALHRQHRPAVTDGLRVLAYGPSTPGLPYVTAAGRAEDEVLRLREALYEALADPALAEPREALLLTGASVLPEEAYRAILEMRDEALARGYSELR